MRVLNRLGRWGSRVAAWGSQGLNVVFLGGHHNRTVSARTYVKAERGAPLAIAVRRTIDTAFFWEEEHCRRSYLRDIEWARGILHDHDLRKDPPL